MPVQSIGNVCDRINLRLRFRYAVLFWFLRVSAADDQHYDHHDSYHDDDYYCHDDDHRVYQWYVLVPMYGDLPVLQRFVSVSDRMWMRFRCLSWVQSRPEHSLRRVRLQRIVSV